MCEENKKQTTCIHYDDTSIFQFYLVEDRAAPRGQAAFYPSHSIDRVETRLNFKFHPADGAHTGLSMGSREALLYAANDTPNILTKILS